MNNSPLPVSTPLPHLGRQPVRISSHALDRFAERVAKGMSRRDAHGRVSAMLATGTVRATPRWWTTCPPAPAQRFVYSALEPDACLVLRDGVVVTVLGRELCAKARAVRAPHGRASSRPRPVRDRKEDWRYGWDEVDDDLWEAA